MFITPKKPTESFNILDSGLFSDVIGIDNKSIGAMTGFTYFDIPTAYEDINGLDGNILPNGGFHPRVYTGFGESETGKTTLYIQIGGAIADSCPGANYVHIDAEGNTTPERIMSLNRWDNKTFRQKCMYIPPSPPITIERVMDIIRKIAHAKDARGEKMKVQTAYTDMYTGEFIKVFPPTFVLLDSIPALVVKATMEEEIDGKKEFKEMEAIGGNVDGLREAKANTSFLRKVKPILDKYNIIFVQINHISKDVPMSMFDKPKKYHPGMKAGEKLNGGKEQVFQSFGLHRIMQKEMLDARNPIYGDDINGYINTLDHVKNKSNVSSSEYRYVFDKRTGFRPELSDFEYLYTNKVGVEGSPAAMFMSILPEIKFTRRNLIAKCHEYPILSRAISFTAKYHMGNHMIVKKRFGEINLKKFAELPFYIRTSVIVSMTIPYPHYNLREFGNDEMVGTQMDAWYGNMFTGLGNGYVSPCNVNILQEIMHNHEQGTMRGVKGSVYDPCPGRKVK